MTYKGMNHSTALFFEKVSKMLGITNESTAVERLAQFIEEQKHQTLLNRIHAIRTNSHYIPDYNKPKVYTDIVISYKDVPISSNTRLAQERPVDFGNDIEKWIKTIHADYLKEKEEKKAKAEAIEKHWAEKNYNIQRAMAPYLRVN